MTGDLFGDRPPLDELLELADGFAWMADHFASTGDLEPAARLAEAAARLRELPDLFAWEDELAEGGPDG
jgi:hypothetical protein